MRKANVYPTHSPNVGFFKDGHVAMNKSWAVARYRDYHEDDPHWLHWQVFDTEAEALAAKDRWEKEGRI